MHAPPDVTSDAFVCPHCGAFAHQNWVYSLFADRQGSAPSRQAAEASAGQIDYVPVNPIAHRGIVRGAFVSLCSHCKRGSLWVGDTMVWPLQTTAPKAHDDMPEDIKRDYNEAALILPHSPRGSAALLRLVIQKLCGIDGDKVDVNKVAGKLHARGMDSQIVNALDILRVYGNNAVHPGTLDITDDHATASRLFELANLIVDGLISRPARITSLYETLPQSQRDAIEARNAKSSPE